MIIVKYRSIFKECTPKMEDTIGPQELSNINKKIQIIEKINAQLLIFFVILEPPSLIRSFTAVAFS